MVADKTILSEEPAAQLASACATMPYVLFGWHHPEIIRVVCANGSRRHLPSSEITDSVGSIIGWGY
jgi:hypothetical protein